MDEIMESKSPEMVKALDKLSESAFGIARSEAIEGHICVICKHPVREFRDELSKKECLISGMCQECQDKVFGGGPESDWYTREMEGYFTTEASIIDHTFKGKMPTCPDCGGTFKFRNKSGNIDFWTYNCDNCNAILEVFND